MLVFVLAIRRNRGRSSSCGSCEAGRGTANNGFDSRHLAGVQGEARNKKLLCLSQISRFTPLAMYGPVEFYVLEWVLLFQLSSRRDPFGAACLAG